MFIHICLPISVCLSLSACLCVCLSSSSCDCLFISVCLSVYMSNFVYLCRSVCRSLSVCPSPSVYRSLSVDLCLPVPVDKAFSPHPHVLTTCFSRAAQRPEFRVNVTLSPSLTEVEVLRHDDTATPPAAPGLTHFPLSKPEAATEVTVWVSHPGSGSNAHPELCEVEIIGGESACPSLYRAGLKGERDRDRDRDRQRESVCVCV